MKHKKGKYLEFILEEESQKQSNEKKSRRTDSPLKNENTATFAIFAEPAVATKAYDPRILEGLVYVSKSQGWKRRVGHVCFAGSALPYIPTFYGKQNQRELIFLGYDSGKEMDKRYAKLLQDSNVPKEVKDSLKRWGANKILTLEEAAEFGRKYFGLPLEDAFPNANIHYIYGEEDNKNFDDHVELEFDKIFVLKEEEEKYLVALRKNQNIKESVEKKRKDLAIQQGIFNLVKGALSSKKEGNVRAKIDSILLSKEKEIMALECPEKFKRAVNTVKGKGDINYKLEVLDRKFKEIIQEERRLEKQEDETTHQLSKIAMQKRTPSFFRSIKRRNLDAAHAEEMRARVKPRYQALLGHIFHNNAFYPHGGNKVDLVLDGVNVALHHQGSVRSVVPGKSDIKKLSNAYAKQNNVPDLIIVGHGAVGMRAVPVPKEIESISPKKPRDTPEVATIIQAATLQSEKELENLVAKSIKNNHTKRYEEKGFASGILLYTFNKKTKEVEIEFTTSNQLLKDYHVGNRIAKLRKELKKAPSKSRSNIKRKIHRLEEKLKFSPVKGLAIADAHFGCANTPGRPSNYSVFEAIKLYTKQEGLPKILILNGDMVHGSLSLFGSDNQYYADTPSEIEQKLEKIFKNKGLSAADIKEKIKQFSRETLAGIPITHSSKQFNEFKNRVGRLIEDILDKNGLVFITSGNHYNNTSHDRDEAMDTVNALLDKKYANHPLLYVFSALGEKSGVGEGELPNKKKLFCCHEPKRGTDQIVGALNQLQSSNQNPYLAVFAHNHHPAVGYGGGSFILNCAGMQPWNSYVSRTGLTPGLRGAVYFQVDKNSREQVKWKFVLDPTLEHLTLKIAKIKKPNSHQ